MSRRILQIVLPMVVLAVGVGVAALLLYSRAPIEQVDRTPAAPRVSVLEVGPESVRLSVETHGTVAPRTESELIPQVSGQVTAVSPALVSGGFFAKGDVLLEVDDRDYRTTLERARATLVRRESEYERARKDLARIRKLHERNVASDSQVDDAVNDEKVANAALREARAALDQARRDLDRTRVTAPFDGRVREESVGVGQYVNAGAPVARVYAIDYAEVRLPVPDRELAFLELPGIAPSDDASRPVVRLHASFAGREHTWEGRVVRTEGEIDPRSRMVHVGARVDDPYGTSDQKPPLAVGLFVRAEISGREMGAVTVLPRAAIQGEDRVWVVDEDDRLRSRTVEILKADRRRVLVGSGLGAGERVVVSPLPAPIEGMTVRPDAGPEVRS